MAQKYDIQIKKLNTSLYLKDGEEISKLLAFIGANKAVLKFEEIRVLRDMRNNVNRIVNCETANLNKTINAALKQIEDIKFIKKMNKFNELSEGLQEIANLRLENSDISLVELGSALTRHPLILGTVHCPDCIQDCFPRNTRNYVATAQSIKSMAYGCQYRRPESPR